MRQTTYTNPLNVVAADPFILQHEGVYYLYATHDLGADRGVDVWTSRDLVHWRWRGLALERTEDTWAQDRFWGAEVIPHDGRFLMFFTASPDRGPVHPQNMQVAIAAGDSPLGPFREIVTPLYAGEGNDEAIDQNLVRGDDGRVYFNWTRVTQGRNEVMCVRLTEDLLSFDGEPVTLLKPEDPWETRAWEGHLVAEGSFIFKHRDWYYLLYTVNHFLDPGYAMGYAVGDHPLGPFTRAPENPILQGQGRLVGVGNGSPILSPDGSEWLFAYHSHPSRRSPVPRQLNLDRMHFVPQEGAPDRLEILGPSEGPHPLPSGAPHRPRGIREDFSGPLDHERWTIVNEVAGQWRIEDGALLLTALDGDTWAERSDYRNLFLVPAPEGSYLAETIVEFEPGAPFEQAFVTVFRDHDCYVRLATIDDGERRITAIYEKDGDLGIIGVVPYLGKKVELRITAHGDHYVFHARVPGGEWQHVGEKTLDIATPYAGVGAFAAASTNRPVARFSRVDITSITPGH